MAAPSWGSASFTDAQGNEYDSRGNPFHGGMMTLQPPQPMPQPVQQPGPAPDQNPGELQSGQFYPSWGPNGPFGPGVALTPPAAGPTGIMALTPH